MTDKACGSCGGAMAPGAITTKDSYYNVAAAHWLEGAPEKSMWTGLKTTGRLLLPVAAYCCQSCGKLEMYAQPPTQA